MDQPLLPPAIPPKKGLSTGCIISIIGASILVPIVVIAILVGMAIPVLQARSVSSGLVIALQGFQTEYNHFPLPKDQAALESTILTSSGSLLDALLGEDDAINPRKVKFFDPPPARKGVNGLLENEGKRTVLDPWGQPYAILLDYDGDGKVADPEHPGAMIKTTVAVFSGGPDGNLATWRDNVKSWKK